jgi:hypothetical protein
VGLVGDTVIGDHCAHGDAMGYVERGGPASRGNGGCERFTILDF